jgi:hypothetical protein
MEYLLIRKGSAMAKNFWDHFGPGLVERYGRGIVDQLKEAVEEIMSPRHNPAPSKGNYLMTFKMGDGDEVELGEISDLDIRNIERVIEKWLPVSGWKTLNTTWDPGVDYITIVVKLKPPFDSAVFNLRKLASL